MLFLLKNNLAFGQTDNENKIDDYEEFTININVDKLGVYELDAIYFNETIYLPIISLFNKLEIYINHSNELDTLNGYVLSESNSFTINLSSNKINFQTIEKPLNNQDYISNFSDVYMSSAIYEEIFKMNLEFNFRELTLYLKSDIELPIIKQLRIKELRKNLKLLNGEHHADTSIQRQYHWFRGAVYDWNLQTQVNQNQDNSFQLKSSFGLELLGGEFNYKNYVVKDSLLRFENTLIKWRYVNDNLKLCRQIELGNVNTTLTGQNYSNFYGIKLTNNTYAQKKSFGSYQIQKKTNPGWDVELYINGILVNFTTADINGDFTFEIPLVFGNSTIMIRYYGPWGQENVEEIFINIPFNFTSHKQLEYQLFTGVTADENNLFFIKSKFSYGLSRKATIGFANEFFDTEINFNSNFSGTLNLALMKNVFLNYSYLHTSNHFIELMLRSKKNFVINLKHIQYFKGQNIIKTTNLGESELNMNLPLINKSLKLFLRNTTRLNYNSSYHTIINESSLSAFYKRFNTGFTFNTNNQTIFTWNTSINLKKNWTLIHKSSFDLSDIKPISTNLQIQKKINKLLFTQTNLNYNFLLKQYQLNLSIYLDFNFLRTALSNTFEDGTFSSTQNLAGSINITTTPKPLFFTNTNSVGRSGIDVLVFLDINHNDTYDNNEPLIKNTSVEINKGKPILTENDSIHRFVSLEPYTRYLLTIKNNGFPSIAWVLEKTTWSVITNPNQLMKLYVPVKPMGEIECNISLFKNNEIEPAKRLIVYIYDQNNKEITRGLTDQDGYYNYLGLKPGNYKIEFDKKQLQSLGLTMENVPWTFKIKESMNGDFIDGIELILK